MVSGGFSCITLNKRKYEFLFPGISLFLSFLLILLSRTADGFAQWYAVNLYPFFPNTLGSFFSLWNFSFFEAGVLFFLVTAIPFVFISFLILIFYKSYRKRLIHTGFKTMLYFLSALILIYTLTCSINYQRDRIGTVLNLPINNTSSEKLEKLTLLLVKDLTELTEDPEWQKSLLTLTDMTYIKTEAIYSMKLLGKQEPSLGGYYPEPKPVYFSDALSKLGIEGFFSPFTMEANYNDKMSSFLIPYTICHEFAHLKGYMKEDDAGFIAYLACRNSPSKIFQYSGAFHALTFTLNALKHEAGSEKFNEIYQKLPNPVRNQLSYINEHRQGQKSASFQSAARSLNNIYLLANAQDQGTKSYGLMVDLLIAEYEDQIDPENML